MKNKEIYNEVELALCRDYKVNVFIRFKNRTNSLINNIDFVDTFEHDNIIIFGQDNGSRIVINCNDVDSCYLRR